MAENNVHIIDWPKEQPLDLNHAFKDELGMTINNWPKMPFEMHMLHNDGNPVPLCIKICEPICARSRYKIGINLMGQPFAEIILSGLTTLFNCRDENKEGNPVNEEEVIIK